MTDRSPDLRDQVADASAALGRQAEERAEQERRNAPRPPLDRRIIAAVSFVAFVAVLVMNRDAFRAPGPDPDAELDATIASMEVARQAVQAHWDSAGAPPRSLDSLGLGALSFTYTATATDFRLSAPSPFGGEVGYQSPTRVSAMGAR